MTFLLHLQRSSLVASPALILLLRLLMSQVMSPQLNPLILLAVILSPNRPMYLASILQVVGATTRLACRARSQLICRLHRSPNNLASFLRLIPHLIQVANLMVNLAQVPQMKKHTHHHIFRVIFQLTSLAHRLRTSPLMTQPDSNQATIQALRR